MPRTSVRRRLTGLLAVATTVAALTAPALPAVAAPDPAASADIAAAETVPVQLLSITDLHGYFGDYTTTVPGAHAGQPAQTVGGGAYLAAHLDRLRAERGLPASNSLLFSAGDDFSGWPAETGWFWNEPTIEYLDMIGLQFSTIGNHELDRNLDYLRHMTEGTCEGRPDGDLCFTDSTGEKFDGADYEYYSANVTDGTGALVAPPYHVEHVSDGRGGSVPVGFIHTTTATTTEGGLSYWPSGELRVTDEAEAVNAYAAELEAQGVKAIVAVMHEGFTQQGGFGFNDCAAPSGPIVEMNKAISPAVDAIVTGHWHALVNCSLPDPAGNPRPVVEAANHGRLISEINLELDRESGEVLRDRTTSVSHANTRDVAPDPDVLEMAQYWRDQLAERRVRHVATQTGDLLRTSDDREESTLANLTADAYLWAAGEDGEAVDLAVSMPGTLLRDLPHAPSSAMPGDAPGAVTFGEVFFGLVVENGIGWAVTTGDVTGRQIHDLLESQWQLDAAGAETFQALAVSGTVRYRYDASAAVGDRVAFGQVRVNGAPLKPNETYRIAALSNNFAQTGFRPPFTALQGAGDQHRTMFSGADAVAGYLEAHSPVAPPALDRVRAVKD